MTCCPTCGQTLSDSGIRFDANAGIVISGTRFASLPRRETQVLEYLWQRQGKYVSREALFLDVYCGDDEPEFNQVIESHVSKLKKKIAGLGIHIRSERFRGYQLVLETGHE